jgi:hypothetical protein
MEDDYQNQVRVVRSSSDVRTFNPATSQHPQTPLVILVFTEILYKVDLELPG